MQPVDAELKATFDTSHQHRSELLDSDVARIAVSMRKLTIACMRETALAELQNCFSTIELYLENHPNLLQLPKETELLGPDFGEILISRLSKWSMPPVNDGTRLMEILLAIDDKYPNTINSSAPVFRDFLSRVKHATDFHLEVEALEKLGLCIGRCSDIELNELKEQTNLLLADTTQSYSNSYYRPRMLYVLVAALSEKYKLGAADAKEELDRIAANSAFTSVVFIRQNQVGIDVIAENQNTNISAAYNYGLLRTIEDRLRINPKSELREIDIEVLTSISINPNQHWSVNARAFEILCEKSPENALAIAPTMATFDDFNLASMAAISLFALPFTESHMLFIEELLSRPYRTYQDDSQAIVFCSIGNGDVVWVNSEIMGHPSNLDIKNGKLKIEALAIPESFKDRIIAATTKFILSESFSEYRPLLKTSVFDNGIEVLNRWNAISSLRAVYYKNVDDYHITQIFMSKVAKNWSLLPELFEEEFKKPVHRICNAVWPLLSCLPDTNLEEFLVNKGSEAVFRALTNHTSAAGGNRFPELIERDRSCAKRLMLKVAPKIESFIRRGDVYKVETFFRILRDIEAQDKSDSENPTYEI